MNYYQGDLLLIVLIGLFPRLTKNRTIEFKKYRLLTQKHGRTLQLGDQ